VKPLELISDFRPTGDQPEAIAQLVEGLNNGEQAQVLLGVTGSGKTFTIANVLEQVQRPVLILSHNKTLAAQLYGEFKQFFPNNAVSYYVSYYDYYQPEAYIPSTNTYIEKDLQINDEIEKLRLNAISALLSGRRDIIVIASVSCIYGTGNPEEYANSIIPLHVGQVIGRERFLYRLVESLYSRTELELTRSKFRVRGDKVEIFPGDTDFCYRITFWGDEIEAIETFNPDDGYLIEQYEGIRIYPANIFVTTQESMKNVIVEIQDDLYKQTEYFKAIGKHLEAKRLEDRVTYDIEMMKELGYCSGIENYSRYIDRRRPGMRPFTLLDYFPDDYILVVDESHVTVPQIHAMYGGDRSRKENLVEYGFRLPSALDNRPLKFEEFETITGQAIYVSATPADYELRKSGGVFVDQVIRPTGLLDPPIFVRPSLTQMDDLLEEIRLTMERKERALVTTLTKRMAEELTKYLLRLDIRTKYIHSDVETLERVEIMRQLRLGEIDVLVGVNLLREGLDLPEVSLVAILDADKEGFLRCERSLTQTAGRAARNINSKVVFYADKITVSMQRTIDVTNRRREKQMNYNETHGITPKQIIKSVKSVLQQTAVVDRFGKGKPYPEYDDNISSVIAADPVVAYMSKEQIQKAIQKVRKEMEAAVKDFDFVEAARQQDEMFALQEKKKKKSLLVKFFQIIEV
jgi:excinuclease ABC subunit B